MKSKVSRKKCCDHESTKVSNMFFTQMKRILIVCFSLTSIAQLVEHLCGFLFASVWKRTFQLPCWLPRGQQVNLSKCITCIPPPLLNPEDRSLEVIGDRDISGPTKNLLQFIFKSVVSCDIWIKQAFCD